MMWPRPTRKTAATRSPGRPRRIDGRSRNAVVRSLSSVSSERVFRESGTRDMCRVVALLPLLTVSRRTKASAVRRAAQPLLGKSAQMGRYGPEGLRCDTLAWA